MNESFATVREKALWIFGVFSENSKRFARIVMTSRRLPCARMPQLLVHQEVALPKFRGIFLCSLLLEYARRRLICTHLSFEYDYFGEYVKMGAARCEEGECGENKRNYDHRLCCVPSFDTRYRLTKTHRNGPRATRYQSNDAQPYETKENIVTGCSHEAVAHILVFDCRWTKCYILKFPNEIIWPAIDVVFFGNTIRSLRAQASRPKI